MKQQEMTTTLTERAETLRTELVELQNEFNTKKEQLIRIEGALEALGALDSDEEPNQDAAPSDSETEGT